jgi:hypothetical protein
MDNEDQITKGVLGTLLVLSGLILGPIWYGYVLSILWGWFIVPTFQLPVLSTAIGIGIAMTIRFITNQDTECEKPEKSFWDRMGSMIGKIFVVPAFALLYGYIIKQFI